VVTWHDGEVHPCRTLVAGCLAILLASSGDHSASGLPESAPRPAAEQEDEATDLERDAQDELLAVITKDQPITPLEYQPEDLTSWRDTDYQVRAEVHDQLEAMFAAAEDAGIGLRLVSAYRSYETQAGTYDWWVRHYGRAAADATSARPGHSEHQTGLAVDLDDLNGGCYLDRCFGDTDAGRWVAKHAHEFGFVISYPEGARDATGYAYEPWHIRYVGPQVAQDMHDRGIALLADYVGLPASLARIGELLGSRG
jgi:D-alanyl-D-alanine carboxypeptidase